MAETVERSDYPEIREAVVRKAGEGVSREPPGRVTPLPAPVSLPKLNSLPGYGHAWFNPTVVERAVPPFFLVGNPRSGTKMLRELLNASPDVWMSEVESHFIPKFTRTLARD